MYRQSGKGVMYLPRAHWLQLYDHRKSGEGRRGSRLVSRGHASSLSSSRLSREFYGLLCSQASAQVTVFIEQRACPRAHELTRLTEQDVGLRPALLYCPGACLQCCPWWFCCQAGVFAFLSGLTYGSPTALYRPLWSNCVITGFVLHSAPISLRCPPRPDFRYC